MRRNYIFDKTDENFFDRNRIRAPRVNEGRNKRKIVGIKRPLGLKEGNAESLVSKGQLKNQSKLGNKRQDKRVKKGELKEGKDSSSNSNISVFHKFGKVT